NVAPVKYAFVVLSDVAYLPPQFEESLKRYVQCGGSALIALGSASATKPRVPTFDEAITEARMASRAVERFQGSASVDLSRPTVSLEMMALHAARSDSDLTMIPKETQPLWQNMSLRADHNNGPGGSRTSRSSPYSFWLYFALALLIVSLVESLSASR